MGKNGCGVKKKPRKKVSYICAVAFLYLALTFLAVNATLLFAGFSFFPAVVPALAAAAAFVSAVVSARCFRKRFLFLFSAVFCFLTSALFFFFFFGSRYKMTSGVLWPLLVIFCGFSFLTAGIWKKKRLVNFYSVIAAAFLFLGVLFFLFSCNIIPLSFSSVFLLVFIPFVLVFAAAVSVLVHTRREKAQESGKPVDAEPSFSAETAEGFAGTQQNAAEEGVPL